MDGCAFISVHAAMHVLVVYLSFSRAQTVDVASYDLFLSFPLWNIFSIF